MPVAQEVQSRTSIWYFSGMASFMMKAFKTACNMNLEWNEAKPAFINVFVLILKHLKLAPFLRYFL